MGAEKFDEMVRLVEEARLNFNEFKGGKKVASTRARKSLQELKKLCQDLRVEIQDMKNGPAAGGAAPPPAPAS